jgi:hypothetical protein
MRYENLNLATQGRTDSYRIESFVVLLMDSYWEICATCKHYVDFRWPDQLEKYGPNTGQCLFYSEEEKKADAQKVVYPLLIVTAESTCDKYETTYDSNWQEKATKVKELIKASRGY